uniref:DDE-1 domain-containing protein n=1 Tax=Strongyloides papillosus TaxID=174720 RepID=A0A0N5B903_STREA
MQAIRCRAGENYEELVQDEESVREWQEGKLKDHAKEYSLKDIFNIDETGLFCVLPNKTFTFKGENCHGGKNSKLRLTVMLGKSKKPRCFQNVKTLPPKYEANKKALMTSDFLEKQMYAFDAKMGTQNTRILLFVNQCFAHLKEINLKNIRIEYLPVNCTSRLQTLDLGRKNAFKTSYRKNVVQRLFGLIESGKDTMTYKISILNVLHYIAKAWKDVSQSTISNSFRKAGFFQTHEEEVIEEDSDLISAWEKLKIDYEVKDFLHFDVELATVQTVSVESLINSVQEESDSDSDFDDDSSVSLVQKWFTQKTL